MITLDEKFIRLLLYNPVNSSFTVGRVCDVRDVVASLTGDVATLCIRDHYCPEPSSVTRLVPVGLGPL